MGKLESRDDRPRLLVEQPPENDCRLASPLLAQQQLGVAEARLAAHLWVPVALERLVNRRRAVRIALGIGKLGELEHLSRGEDQRPLRRGRSRRRARRNRRSQQRCGGQDCGTNPSPARAAAAQCAVFAIHAPNAWCALPSATISLLPTLSTKGSAHAPIVSCAFGPVNCPRKKLSPAAALSNLPE